MKCHKIEYAKIEELNLPIGKIDLIILSHVIESYGNGTYGEVYCEEPYKLRVHRNCEVAFGMGVLPYKGVLSTILQDDEEGFKRFSKIAERLELEFREKKRKMI